MNEILLTKGKVALVDDGDYEHVMQHKWHAQNGAKSNIWYALTNVRVNPDSYKPQRRILLHRMILNPPPGMVVDHIDGNGLNCVRSNIRICTPSDNAHNKSIGKDNTSGYKGIYFYKKLNKWGAFVCYNYKQLYLGVFSSPVDAAYAYDQKARELFGEFAKTNFTAPR